MRVVKGFLFIGLYLYINTLFSQNLKFYREDLTFEIKDGYFYVDGFYNFCNNGDKGLQQILFYPFPLDTLYGVVDSVSAEDINKQSVDVMTNKTAQGAFFKVELEPYGIGKFRICYRQKILKNKAEYILVTTQKWGSPFETVFYKLITSNTLKIVSSSYNPDSTAQIEDKVFYYWTRKNFMPEKNMVFYFKR